MKIYISGPITGKDREAVGHAFEEAKRFISEAGHTPVSPLENGLTAEARYKDHIVRDLDLMLGCEAILLLYGWNKSKGCRIEHFVAINMGLIIFTNFASLRRVNGAQAEEEYPSVGW